MRRQKRHAPLFLPRNFSGPAKPFSWLQQRGKGRTRGSDNSLPPESFRIVSVEPEDAAEQVSIQTALKVIFNLEINQETVYPGSILLLQNSTFI